MKNSNSQVRLAHPLWERTLLTFLVIPLAVVSCAAVPETKTGGSASILPSHSAPNPQAYFHFLRGYLAERDNDSTLAIQEYRLGLQHDPESVYLKTRMARLYFSRGEMGAAIATLSQIDDDTVEEVSSLTQMAKIYEGAGQPQRALDLYDRAIERDPEIAQTYFSKGKLLFSQKRYEEAKGAFERGVQLAPQSHEGYFYLGKVHEKAGDFSRAEEQFQKAIKRKPKFQPAYQALVAMLESQEEFQKAIEVYRGYLQTVNPHKKEFRQQLIRLLLRRGAYDQAVEELEQIVADNPEDLYALVRIALIHGEMGDHERAIADLKGIVHAHPSELRVRDYLGLMYEEIKDYDKAIGTYRTNLDLAPTFYDSRLHLGYLMYRLKRYDEAIPQLKQAVQVNPKNPESHLLLGLTYLQSEQQLLATETFKKGLELHPKHTDLRFNLGAAYDKLDRFPDVVREMETVLQMDPNHADALNYLGYSYADRGINIQKALELTKRAVALKPENGYYVDSLGWALFKMGRIEEALDEIKRAAGLVKNDPIIFEHLGEIYLKKENREKARKAWIQSIELDPSNLKLIRRFQENGLGKLPQGVGIGAGESQISWYAPDLPGSP